MTSLVVLSASLFLSASIAQEKDVPSNPYEKLEDGFTFLESGDPLVDWNSTREWTSSDGRTLKAKILKATAEQGQFLLANNQVASIPLSRFSEADQRFVQEWREISRFFNPGFEKKRGITDTIEAEMMDGAFAKDGTEHETRNFRFVCDHSLTAATVKDFSRLFEATYMMVRSLPIGLEVSPPGESKFMVRLFAEKETYHQNGGPENSAGVYITKSQEILVPLESLGVKRAGTKFRKSSSYDPATLIHETTHAVTHQWLQYMPLWVAEGLAEYVAAIPYKDGVFYPTKIEDGLEKLAASNFGGDKNRYDLLEPEEFVYLSNDEFMDRPQEKVEPIILPTVEPYQIRYLTEEDQKKMQTEMAAKKPREPMGFTITGMAPPVPINRIPSPIVIQRYSSSMMLVHELMSGGQIENFRKFLFAQLHNDWDSKRYLNEFQSTLKSHEAAVKKQVSDFQDEFDRFQQSVENYNGIVRRLNAGLEGTLPPTPVKPVPPDAIKVPEILSSPRPKESFSRERFQESAVEKYLKLPEKLRI